MRLPDPVHDTLVAYFTRFGLPAGEDAQRQNQQRVCETVRARHGAGWGWKRADPGRPPSLDALAFRENGRLFIWDLVRDAGGPGRQTSFSRGQEGEDVTGQVFIEVQALDHLGGGAQPQPTPAPTPAPHTPAVDLSGLVAAVERLTAHLDEVEANQERMLLVLGQVAERLGNPIAGGADLGPLLQRIDQLQQALVERLNAPLRVKF